MTDETDGLIRTRCCAAAPAGIGLLTERAIISIPERGASLASRKAVAGELRRPGAGRAAAKRHDLRRSPPPRLRVAATRLLLSDASKAQR
jgi:hypothetical protein